MEAELERDSVERSDVISILSSHLCVLTGVDHLWLGNFLLIILLHAHAADQEEQHHRTDSPNHIPHEYRFLFWLLSVVLHVTVTHKLCFDFFCR